MTNHNKPNKSHDAKTDAVVIFFMCLIIGSALLIIAFTLAMTAHLITYVALC